MALNILRDHATKVCVTKKLILTKKQREQLETLVARRSAPAGHVRRARVILLSADGVRGNEIAERLSLSYVRVSQLRTRFLETGVDGLADLPKAGRKDHAVSLDTENKILEMALSPPPAGRSRWTTRLLGRAVSLSSWTISKILRKHDVKPHLLRTYKISRDPAFAEKVHDVVGLYLNPPENAIVLSVDEKTQVQALERTQLPLPLRQGRAVRHTHDYKRHGVIDLYAALNVETGEVTHACTETHTAADFLSFMRIVIRRNPEGELHVILDNSSTHSTPAVKAWLEKNPRVHFHYTPTSASWLNLVEGFFGILAKQSLSLTDFPSKKALREHIEAYISGWNDHPTPFIWTKPAKAIIKSREKMLKRTSLAVH
jgi:transposase